jgi:hypothetical protein
VPAELREKYPESEYNYVMLGTDNHARYYKEISLGNNINIIPESIYIYSYVIYYDDDGCDSKIKVIGCSAKTELEKNAYQMRKKTYLEQEENRLNNSKKNKINEAKRLLTESGYDVVPKTLFTES